ncbi:hypothetical protein [Acinetobacter baumannii]|nr:hypothetical protein [Acinetobacter baumannii]
MGFAIAYYFNKAKAGLHPDYMLHLTYWGWLTHRN